MDSSEQSSFYGIIHPDDSYKNIDTKYIQNEASAINLRNLKFYNMSSQHLQIELNLPLSYIDLETGDLVKFPKDKLIDGIKAHGIDYTNPTIYGYAARYPLFQVVSINKNIDSVKIKLHQLHALSSIEESSVHFTNDWVDYFEGADEIFSDPSFYIAQTYQPFSELLIGHSSSFQLSELTTIISSYSREFIITDITIGDESYPLYALSFSLKDNFDSLFGLQRFDITNWNDLIPEQNSDGSGYGGLLNGQSVSQVSGFIAMEIRFIGYNGEQNKVLSLRNIKDTEFDNEIYDPDTTMIPESITPSNTEMKLGWVLYHCDNEWNYLNPWSAGNTSMISTNLSILQHPTIVSPNEIQQSMIYTYNMVLYPYFNPIQNLTLSYAPEVQSMIEIPLFADINLDGQVDILDVITLVSILLGNIIPTSQQSVVADINQDSMINLLDVIELMNYVMENQ